MKRKRTTSDDGELKPVPLEEKNKKKKKKKKERVMGRKEGGIRKERRRRRRGKREERKKRGMEWRGARGVMCDLCMAGAWHNVLLLIILRSLSRVNDAEGSVLRRWNETRGLYTHLCSTLVYSSHSMLVTGLCTLSRVLHIQLY